MPGRWVHKRWKTKLRLSKVAERKLKDVFAQLTDFTRDNVPVGMAKFEEIGRKLKISPESVYHFMIAETDEQSQKAYPLMMEVFKRKKIWSEEDIKRFSETENFNCSLVEEMLGGFQEKEAQFLVDNGIVLDELEYIKLFSEDTSEYIKNKTIEVMEMQEQVFKKTNAFYEFERMRQLREIVDGVICEEDDYSFVMGMRRIMPGETSGWREKLFEELYMRNAKPSLEDMDRWRFVFNLDHKAFGNDAILSFMERRSAFDAEFGVERKDKTPENEVRFEKACLYYGASLEKRLVQVAKWAPISVQDGRNFFRTWMQRNEINQKSMRENQWFDWQIYRRQEVLREESVRSRMFSSPPSESSSSHHLQRVVRHEQPEQVPVDMNQEVVPENPDALDPEPLPEEVPEIQVEVLPPPPNAERGASNSNTESQAAVDQWAELFNRPEFQPIAEAAVSLLGRDGVRCSMQVAFERFKDRLIREQIRQLGNLSRKRRHE